ncbi:MULTISPECIES: iron chelate uptake ABC transporter family permease subunit [Exiguobacterium]|uniref:iron chelate uptake ABC transporter family permease subunit n=1 Tax=Exiguobacterium TaxID=33986 RepID=UPI001BE8657A|nr:MULTISPECIES: iron chelate uptake ABC transporter family permease subunit [Exiguobacterium]MCT4781713.1 iron chelate uptake ABC transporter family permease subunit [Exiguobacterium himgiriensis]
MSTVIEKEGYEVDVRLLQEKERSASAFRSRREERRYWLFLAAFIIGGVFCALGLLLYNNPVALDSPSFWPVVERRVVAVTTMAIAALCQSLATVAFHSVTNNRIITPSLLGYDALYSTIQTSMIFFFGAGALVGFTGTGAFLTQVGLMVLMSLLLYGWLLSGKYANLQLMLLVGIIIGTGLNSVSTFMRRMLAPSDFDILQARLFGSVTNADAAYFPIVIPIVIVVGVLLYAFSNRLNLVALGKDVATSFGVDHRMSVIYTLILISLLMSVSTALIGPLTFFGFLVATLSYQVASTYDHKYVFPMAFALGFFVLTSAYFFMYHIFNTPSVVSVIIELFGGIIFLAVILKRRSL